MSEQKQQDTQGAEEPKPVGTFVLTLVFLASFAVYYFANWKALADLWHVR